MEGHEHTHKGEGIMKTHITNQFQKLSHEASGMTKSDFAEFRK